MQHSISKTGQPAAAITSTIHPPSLQSSSSSASVRAQLLSVKKWSTAIQSELQLKCLPSLNHANTSEDGGVPLQSLTAARELALLSAVSTSQTFLFLIHAIQRTHPQRLNSQAISKAIAHFPIHMQLVTLATIIKRGTACRGDLFDSWPSESNDAASQTAKSSDHTLPLVDDILMGRLVMNNRDQLTMLCVSDATGTIPVVVSGATPQLLNRWCLFPRWTFLPLTHGTTTTTSNGSVVGVLEIDAQVATPLPDLHVALSESGSMKPVPWNGFSLPPIHVTDIELTSMTEAALRFDTPPEQLASISQSACTLNASHASVAVHPIDVIRVKMEDDSKEAPLLPQSPTPCSTIHHLATSYAVNTPSAHSTAASSVASSNHLFPITTTTATTSSKRKSTEPSHSPHLAEDPTINQDSISDEPDPKRHKKHSSSNVCNLRATVSSISPLIQHEKSQPFFFVEVVQPDESANRCSSLSTLILFTGVGSLRWYHFLQLNHEYVFTRLRTSTLFQDQPECKRMVFVNTAPAADTNVNCNEIQSLLSRSPFEDTRKQTLVIHSSMFPQLAFREASSNAESHAPVPTTTSSASTRPYQHSSSAATSRGRGTNGTLPSTISYTGEITATPIWGVYQLDHDDRLLLFLPVLAFQSPAHHPWLSLGMGLRIGARICIHHAHVLRDGRKVRGLLCCTYSHIEILRFSTNTHVPTPFDYTSKKFNWYVQLWTNHAYRHRDIAMLLRAFIDWKKKMGSICSSHHLLALPKGDSGKHSNASTGGGILYRFLAKMLLFSPQHSSSNHQSMELYQQFFSHETCSILLQCQMNSARSARSLLPTFVPLFDLIRCRPLRTLKESFFPRISQLTSPKKSGNRSTAAALMPSPTVSSLEWSFRTMHSAQVTRRFPQLTVVGVLQATMNPTQIFPAPASNVVLNTATGNGSKSLVSPFLRSAWQLVDQSGTIDCLIIGEITAQHMNALLHVPNYVVVMETSPFHSAFSAGTFHGIKYDRVLHYLVFHIRDVVILQPNPKKPPVPSHAQSAPAVTELLVTYKSDTITVPSVHSSAAHSSSSSPQTTLSTGAFNPMLQLSFEVQLIEKSKPHMEPRLKPATLQIHASANELYPFIHAPAIVRFSGLRSKSTAAAGLAFTADSSTFLHSAGSIPPPIPIPSQSLLQVRDLLVCALPLDPIPIQGMQLDVVSFQGLVLEKQFRLEPIANTTAASSIRRMAQFRRWWLHVRDVEANHTVTVYVDPTLHCFVSILPGSVVAFHRMSRRLTNKYHIQVEDTDRSHVQLVQSLHLPLPDHHEADEMNDRSDEEDEDLDDAPRVVSNQHAPRSLQEGVKIRFPSQPLPYTFLRQLRPYAETLDERTYRFRVRISLLNKLVMKWCCGSCGREIPKGTQKCISYTYSIAASASGAASSSATTRSPCTGPLQLFLESTALVDDGSAVATLFVDGPLVWDLLNLKPNERTILEELSLDCGGFEFYRASPRGLTDDGFPLDSNLHQAVRRAMWERRLRENYIGMELIVFVKHVFMKGVIEETVTREKHKRASQSASSSSSSTSTNPTSFAASPFQSSTFESPPLTLKAIEIQPIAHNQTRTQARALLQHLEQTIRV